MINSTLLKKKAEEMGIRQRDIAHALGIDQSTTSLKINNRRPMYLREAEIIADLLKIGDEMFAVYFFSKTVA